MGRGLSESFIKDLKDGPFKPILMLVKADSTLCMEIRENYINLYYRGGNILRVEEKTDGSYYLFFDRNYLDENKTIVPKNLNDKVLPGKDDSKFIIDGWINAIPFLKNEMDLWFGQNPKEEKEFQQLLVRENNIKKSAKGTDYYVCDLEYSDKSGRFDLVAVRWPSTSAERKNNKGLRLAIIEMKYLDAALKGDSGIRDHIKKLDKFINKRQNLIKLKNEMKTVFNQKIDLGLIDNKNKIENFSDEYPEYIFVISNHDPASKILYNELSNLPAYSNFELKFAASNLMGYGLYKENIYSLEEFRIRFAKQIYSKT